MEKRIKSPVVSTSASARRSSMKSNLKSMESSSTETVLIPSSSINLKGNTNTSSSSRTKSLKEGRKKMEISEPLPRSASTNDSENLYRRALQYVSQGLREDALSPKVVHLASGSGPVAVGQIQTASQKASKIKLDKSSAATKSKDKDKGKKAFYTGMSTLSMPKTAYNANASKLPIIPKPKGKLKPVFGPIKIKSKTKKIKKNKGGKSRSWKDANPNKGSSTDHDNLIGEVTGQEQYIKELNAINELLRSITIFTKAETTNGTTTTTATTTAVSKHFAIDPMDLKSSFSRPFSAEELSKLVASVGKVAAIHYEHIPGTSNIADAVIREMLAKNSAAEEHAKKLDSVKLTADNELILDKSQSKSKRKKNRKSRKSKSKSKSNVSKYSVSKSESNAMKLKKSKSNVSASKSKSNKALFPSTSGKSSIKSLYRSVRATKKKSRDRSLQQRNSDTNLSVMSELDLVKSAMLNKRFYEESIALATMDANELNKKVPEVIQKKAPAPKKRITFQDLRKIAANTNTTPSSSNHDSISPKISEVSLDPRYASSKLQHNFFKGVGSNAEGQGPSFPTAS